MQIYLTADDENGTEKLNFHSDGQNYVHLLSYLYWHPSISQQTQPSQNKVRANVLKFAYDTLWNKNTIGQTVRSQLNISYPLNRSFCHSHNKLPVNQSHGEWFSQLVGEFFSQSVSHRWSTELRDHSFSNLLCLTLLNYPVTSPINLSVILKIILLFHLSFRTLLLPVTGNLSTWCITDWVALSIILQLLRYSASHSQACFPAIDNLFINLIVIHFLWQSLDQSFTHSVYDLLKNHNLN